MAKWTAALTGTVLALFCTAALAAESFEFVAEHLPEAAMDNRFATLPLWGLPQGVAEKPFALQAGYMQARAGGLTLQGPMAAIAGRRPLGAHHALTAFAFLDELGFSGADQRPLETLFTTTPLSLPAEASFTGLEGTARHIGAGLSLAARSAGGMLGEHEWVGGLLWQRMALRDYRAAYEVLSGPSTGATGFVDYSADYSHLTPFVGLALPRRSGSWSYALHTLFALPLPRRGLQGRISGPGFDLSGDTETAGNGKHFGDASLTVGFDLTYLPWGLTLDLGSVVTQALVEPLVHRGISRNLVVSGTWHF